MSTARRACLMLLCLLALSPAAGSAEQDNAEGASPRVKYVALAPPFVVNFGTTGRIGYLKADVSLRVSPAAVAEVQHHMPALRHALIMLLSGQSAEALAAPEQREALRLAALQAVRAVIAEARGEAPAAGEGSSADAAVQDLLFTSFLVQR